MFPEAALHSSAGPLQTPPAPGNTHTANECPASTPTLCLCSSPCLHQPAEKGCVSRWHQGSTVSQGLSRHAVCATLGALGSSQSYYSVLGGPLDFSCNLPPRSTEAQDWTERRKKGQTLKPALVAQHMNVLNVSALGN